MSAPEKSSETSEAPPEIPAAAEAIIKAVQESLKPKEIVKETPAPQPTRDTAKEQADWREAKKKKMGWNDVQMDSYLDDIRTAQAPLVRDNALMNLKSKHKDFEQLEKVFLSEVERYEKAGRVIDNSLAEELFFMVKGKELSAGRYTPPESQPKKDLAASSTVSRPPTRIAPAYNPSVSGSGDPERSGSPEITAEEKDYQEFMDQCANQVGSTVTPEEYVKHREEKKKTRQAVDRVVPPIDIDLRTAGPADRDLASLWNRGSVRR